MRRGGLGHRAALTYDPSLWRPKLDENKSAGRRLASTGAGGLEKKAFFAFSFKTEATRVAAVRSWMKTKRRLHCPPYVKSFSEGA